MKALVGLAAVAAVAALAWWLLGDGATRGETDVVTRPRTVVAPDPDGAATPPLVVDETVTEPERLAAPTPTRTDTPPSSRPPAFVVIDAETGERIRRGTILASKRDPGWQRNALARRGHHPPDGFDMRLVDDAPFPERLALGSDRLVLWVTAPGYAWEPHVRDPERESDVVELHRAGHLVLRFAPPASACARGALDVALTRGRRAFTPDDAPRGDGVTADDVLRYGRLPVGGYDVAVHTTSSLDAGVRLHEATLHVRAGEVTDVTLPLADTPGGTLEVVVTLPPGAELPGSPAIVLRDPRDDTRLGYGGHGEWVTQSGEARFVARCLEPRSYHVTGSTIDLSQVVDVFPGQTTTIRHDMTDHARVTVELEGCLGAQPATLVSWQLVDEPRTTFQEFAMSSPVTLWVPPRPVRLQAVGATLSSADVILSPTPREELTVTLTCDAAFAANAVITFVGTGDGPIPESTDFMRDVDVAPIGHDGSRRLLTTTHGIGPEDTFQLTITFDTPGRYAVTYPASWDDTATIELEAGPGEREPVVVELR